MDLRPYQVGAIEGARQQIREGKKRVLLVCPTGGGKTVVAAAIIRSAVAMRSSVLFLAHRRELIGQTSEKLQRFEVPHGVIQAGYPMKLHHQVQVASVQTLVRRPDALRHVDLIFVDEAHHAAAGSWSTILGWFPNAKVVGLTATPWRLDGKGLSDIFDGHVLVATPEQLHLEGYLCAARCFTFRPIDTAGVAVRGGDFAAGELSSRAQEKQVVGDVVGRYLEACAGKRAVLFACDVEHSKMMAQAFVDRGVPAEHLDGETHPALRAAILARLRAGETHVLCNVNVATEGWDCPELEAVLLCRPTLSEALYLQMVGRGLRTCEGKVECRIHDHARLLPAFGHPYDERDWEPTRTAKSPRRDVEQAVVRIGAEVTRKAPELVLQAQMEEYGRGTERVGMPPKPFFASMSQMGRKQFYLRMVVKHGLRKAKAIYRWASGEREWPSRTWEADAIAAAAGGQAA